MKDPHHIRRLAHGSALVAAVAVGFLGGRWTTEAPAELAGPAPATATAARATTARPPVELRPPSGASAPGPAEPHDHGHVADPGAAAVAARDVTLEEVLGVLRRAWDAPGDAHAAEAAAAAAGALEEALLSRPEVLRAAMERFARTDDPAELDLLGVLLGRVRDPEVEALALEAARTGRVEARRVAALAILDGLETPLAQPLALELLAHEPAAAVRRAAVDALPAGRGTSQGEASEVVGGLAATLARDPDAETRRRAAVAFPGWARDDADLRALTRGLRADASVDVRAACAFGLEMAGARDPEVLDALCASVLDEGEDPTVRQLAWRALEGLSPLPAPAYDVYERYRLAWEAAGEVSHASR